VTGVQEQAAEHLVVPVAQAGDEEVSRRAWTRQQRALAQPLEVMAAHQLQRGLELGPARRADAVVAAGCLAASRQQPAERAELGEQGTRQLQRIAAAVPVPQQHSQQFRLGQRLGAPLQQLLPRAFVDRPVAYRHGPLPAPIVGGPRPHRWRRIRHETAERHDPRTRGYGRLEPGCEAGIMTP